MVTIGSSNMKRSLTIIVDDIRVGPLPKQNSKSILNSMLNRHMNRGVASTIRNIGSSTSVKQELNSLYVTTFYGL